MSLTSLGRDAQTPPSFDWYSATVQRGEDEVLGEFLAEHRSASYRPGKPLHGYTNAADLHAGDTVLARAMWGGVNSGTHIWASGSNSPEFARFMRRVFPEHTVSRADIATDYNAPDSFKILSNILKKFALEKKLTTSVAGDWLGGQNGRTLYLGSTTSTTRVRLYEKGIQLDANPDWVRCELVVRPANPEGKAWLAKAEPSACWGASKWTATLSDLLFQHAPERARVGTLYKPSDTARALHWLLKQYGPLLNKLAEQAGGWEALGPVLRDGLSAGTQQGQMEFQFGEAPTHTIGHCEMARLDAILGNKVS